MDIPGKWPETARVRLVVVGQRDDPRARGRWPLDWSRCCRIVTPRV